MNIVFWNIKKNEEIYDKVIELIKENDVDILLLCESPFGIFSDLKKHPSFNTFRQVSDGDSKVEVYSRVSLNDFKIQRKAKRWTGFEFVVPQKIRINLFSVHFPSKVNWSEASLALECVNFANDIKKLEKDVGHQNTILIGDFNMNPFESGMMSANGLNAIQDLEYSKSSKGRIVNGIHYDFFYNPMWSFFGDKITPYGTHYSRNSENISYEWNILDQVIIRPDLSEHISKDSVDIITKINGVKLDGNYFRPNTNMYSDHYPIKIHLNI